MNKVFFPGFAAMGSTYLILSAAQQLLVNKLVITSLVTILISTLYSWFLRNDRKLMLIPACIGAVNISGLFIQRYTMVEILGLISFAAGIILTIYGIMKLFHEKAKTGKKIGAIAGAAFFSLSQDY